MSFLKNIFKKEVQQRQITDVNQLKKDDIIVLTDSFALPEMLRGQQFQITAVNSYEFEHANEIEWVLKGNNNAEIYLGLDIDDEVYLKFSLKLAHADVETLFDLDEFSTIFEQPGQAELTRQNDSDLTTGWSDEHYRQTKFCQVGYFHRKDHRCENLSPYDGKDAGEQFELYQLLNMDESHGVELEVWQDGDTDVFLTIYRPTTDIVDMFPGS
ncbi:hypothetical protein [Thalassotalea ganghwensis]